MFTTSFGQLSLSVLANILIPLIPGIAFLRLLFGTKIKGMLLYVLARFIGVGVVAHFLFDLQFIRFGVGITEYLRLLVLLALCLGLKRYIQKFHRAEYLHTLYVSRDLKEIADSRRTLSLPYKVLTGSMGISILRFLISSFVYTTHLPTYADDSFSNRNRPIVNIIHDGGVKLFGAKEEILARGRLGYPVHIAGYKALISEIQGGYNDVYTDMWQWCAVLFCFVFLGVITRAHTKDLFSTLAPLALLTSLPLFFMHSIESYHDLPLTLYAIITARAIYSYVSTADLKYMTLGLLCAYIMSYIKIEGLIIYFPAIIFAAGLPFLFDKKQFVHMRKNFSWSFSRVMENIGLFVLFFVPFQIVRIWHGLGFNPSSLETGEVLDKTIHREIFDNFGGLFFGQDNYGIALIPVVLMIVIGRRLFTQQKYTLLYFLFLPIIIFILFTLVFLLTNNYQWVLNQTTVNRVYTMCFVVAFAFIGWYIYEYKRA